MYKGRKAIYFILSSMAIAAVSSFLWTPWYTMVYMPKPLGYPRIVLPAHTYTPLSGHFPYTFAVSSHAVVKPAVATHADKYWINIYYPTFDATIHLPYKPVQDNPRLLREYCDDAYQLTAKHQVRASSIEEKAFKTPEGNMVVMALLSGQVPSQVQFYVTDTKQHFLRGALYFTTATQNEYLAPIIAFIQEDILHLLHTLAWK